MRVSMSSLTWMATSLSISASSRGDPAVAFSPTVGAPEVKCSMMAPRMAGFIICQSLSPDLVTVIESGSRNIPATPSTSNTRAARGEASAAAASGKSAVSDFRTGSPGRNFMASGFDEFSVWMNMVLAPQQTTDGAGRGRRSPLRIIIRLSWTLFWHCPGPKTTSGNLSDIPQMTSNLWKSYHGPISKVTLFPLQPSDDMILVIGQRVEAIWSFLLPSRHTSRVAISSPSIPSAYAGTGLRRRSLISSRICWNKLLGTATSAD